MNFYFVMNRSGQYLDSNLLWTDDWPKAKRSVTLPAYDEKLIGVYEVFVISEAEAVCQGRPTKFQKAADFEKLKARGDLDFVLKYGMKPEELDKYLIEPCRHVPPSQRAAFFAEYKTLCERFKPVEFRPNVRYNADCDQLEVYLTDAPSFCDPVGPKAPGIMIQREFESKAITGVKIQGFLERLAGADPSVQYMKIDLEFAFQLCEMYKERIESNGPAWTWKPEELEFFKAVKRLWPGMSHKFLQELP